MKSLKSQYWSKMMGGYIGTPETNPAPADIQKIESPLDVGIDEARILAEEGVTDYNHFYTDMARRSRPSRLSNRPWNPLEGSYMISDSEDHLRKDIQAYKARYPEMYLEADKIN